MFIIGKIISEGETKFAQHEYNKLQKISAKNKSQVQKCKYGIIYSSITWCIKTRNMNTIIYTIPIPFCFLLIEFHRTFIPLTKY